MNLNIKKDRFVVVRDYELLVYECCINDFLELKKLGLIYSYEKIGKLHNQFDRYKIFIINSELNRKILKLKKWDGKFKKLKLIKI